MYHNSDSEIIRWRTGIASEVSPELASCMFCDPNQEQAGQRYSDCDC